MNPYQRLFSSALLALAPLSLAGAQSAGKTLAMDFRTSISIQGAPDTTVMLGHAVGSVEKMRLDVSGAAAKVSPLKTDSVSMIVTDSGKTITYLDAKNNQYMRVRPSEIVSKAQQMSGMKMEFSGTEAKVDNLGSGPTILGHPTTHYRVATGMTMTVSAKGMQQSVKIASTTDSYYANDIIGNLNPFASLSGSDMANMFGSGNAEFAQKLKAAQAKLPKGTPLRAASSATIVAQGQTRVTTTAAEVTSVKWVNADPKAFEIPAGYTEAAVPGMMGASNATQPK
ncbi:MAG TPA: DUF4412 domain-containing protein [Gemmatimonadaceae bacterium]|jgi:hypothetical protein|nr:DUF4412 domain-containing protein [Gemmatimonadaceae bacterium]